MQHRMLTKKTVMIFHDRFLRLFSSVFHEKGRESKGQSGDAQIEQDRQKCEQDQLVKGKAQDNQYCRRGEAEIDEYDLYHGFDGL